MKQKCKCRSKIRSNHSCLSKRTQKMTFLYHSWLEKMKRVKAELSVDVWRAENAG